MNYILNFFVTRSFLVNIISVFICIVGVILFINLKRDLIPNLQFKVITVQATLPGASAIDMEKHVTFPIEESISNIADLETIISNTTNSSSMLTIVVKSNVQNVAEVVETTQSRIEAIKSKLPKDILPITVKRLKVDSSWIQSISVTGVNELNDTDRDWAIKLSDAINKIPGVIKVNSSMKERNIYITFQKEKVAKTGISVSQIRKSVLNALSYIPIGEIEKNEKSIAIEMKKEIESITDLGELPILGNRSGNILYLSDVAKIEYRAPKKKLLSLIAGKEVIALQVEKDLDSDAILLGKKIHKAISAFNATSPPHIKAKVIDDGPNFIKKQLSVLFNNGLTGLIIVLISLFVLLGFRISLMTAFGIPLSYLGTVIVLHLLDVSIDLISIIGMILVIGILVDDAIIVAEKYVQNLSNGMIPKEAALDAAHSTIIPVTGTVITTIVAFAPILFIKSDLSNVLFAIPCVIITALAFSWFESFFILPNHLQHFVKSKSKRADNLYFQKLKSGYKVLLKWSLKLRYPLLVFILTFMGFSIYWSINKVPHKFSLTISNEELKIIAVLKESDSFDTTRQKLKPLMTYLDTLENKHIDYIKTKIGSVYIGKKERTGFRYAEVKFSISMNIKHPKKVKERLLNKIKVKLAEFKTADFKELYVKKQMKGANKDKEDIITIFVSGKDKISFEEIQNSIQEGLKDVKNIQSIYMAEDRFQKSWQFIVNKKELVKYGVTSTDLAAQLSVIFAPIELGQVRLRGENITIYTQFENASEFIFEILSNIEILTPNGTAVPTSYFGTWKQVKVLKNIEHKNMLRKFEIDVRYDNEKVKKLKIAQKIQAAIAPIIKKYPTYNFEVQKTDEDSAKNKKWMLQVATICVGLIILVLAIVLNSIVYPFLVAFAIPFGVIGIIWALYFHGMELGIMSIIGLIGMAGVVVNDSLIMVDHINKISKDSKNLFCEDIIAGASSRLRAILLTTITTLGGVFPMAYGLGGESGFTQPLAFSMGWGLTFATILTLFIIPALILIKADLENICTKCFFVLAKLKN